MFIALTRRLITIRSLNTINCLKYEQFCQRRPLSTEFVQLLLLRREITNKIFNNNLTVTRRLACRLTVSSLLTQDKF